MGDECDSYESYGVYLKSVVHLSEGSFVRNVIVQILIFDAKPNHKPNPNPSPSHNPNPIPIFFGQMTLQTSEFSEFFTFVPVIQLNPTHPSDHTHFSAIQLQFMLNFHRPGLTAMHQTTPHTSCIYLAFQF